MILSRGVVASVVSNQSALERPAPVQAKIARIVPAQSEVPMSRERMNR